jgi:hypothetical protein
VRTPIAALIFALVLGLGGTSLAGCGLKKESDEERAAEEHEGGEEGEGSEAGREEAERAEAAKEIAVEDRVAYYQLTTTSGLLRSNLAAAKHGDPPSKQDDAEALAAAQSRVRRAQPKDSGLQDARRRLLALLSASEAGKPSRAEAARRLQKLDEINAALSRFLSREPAQAVLVPD